MALQPGTVIEWKNLFIPQIGLNFGAIFFYRIGNEYDELMRVACVALYVYAMRILASYAQF